MLYNVELIRSQMELLGFDETTLAKAAKLSLSSVYAALAGRLGTLKRLKRIADVLLIKWEYITHIDLPEKEFRRAVLTTGDRGARPVKPRPVYGSANRPRI